MKRDVNALCRGTLVWMRSTAMILVAILALAACQSEFKVTVSNSLPIDRRAEMVAVTNPFPNARSVRVTDEQGRVVPSQVTYDGDVIFLVDISAREMQEYTLTEGKAETDTVACGRVYPERDDDLAWENDKAGFRAYGPSLEARGEKGFGYDLFAKRGTTAPVLEELYDKHLHGHQPYHEDHGHGLDCYAVGPTLGAGVAALMQADSLLYPWCYRSVRVLDNGPLRFTAELTFEPKDIEGDTTVIETRLITLDAGSYLNRTVVFYKNLKHEMPLAAGLSIHDTEGEIVVDAHRRYVAYEDPTQGTENGKLYLGIVSTDSLTQAGPVYFTEEERARRNGTLGHVLAVRPYTPGEDFTYYWGFGWSKHDMPDMKTWQRYLQEFVMRLKEPLMVSGGF